MYKAIIIDDEKWIIEGIKNGVRWNTYGFQVIGDARNGMEGLELIEKLRPDFVLTDIKMPLVNGLELIKHGKEISPQTTFAVLSGHAEFAYAQKALNYGAFGYCLKPFEIDEIENMLNKLAISLKQQIKNNLNQNFQYMYEIICSGDEELLQKKLSAAHMPISTTTPITPIVFQGDYENVPHLEDIHHIRFRMNKKRIGILVYSNLAEMLLNSFNITNNTISYSIGIGPSAVTPAEIEISLEAASVAAYGCFSTGKSGVYQANSSSETIINNLLLELTHTLTHKDTLRFLSLMESFKPLFHSNSLTIKDAYLIFNTVMFLFTIDGITEYIRFLEGYEQLYHDFDNSDAMIDYLVKHTLNHLSDELSSKLACVSNDRIKEILTYIHQHFDQPLSIQCLSEKFHLSPNYLSQLFKKEVGENFVEYLSHQRIKYACKLLTETNMTVSQIGLKCGFNDYFYFTRIFKRINGITPTQYRERT